MMKQINNTKTINEMRALRRLQPFVWTARSANKSSVGLLALLMLVSHAAAATFSFSTGEPDGKVATLSRPSSPGKIQTETADDFVVTQPVVISQATFTGLLPLGADLSSIGGVEIEIYHVFPGDSDTNRVPAVLTRANSPGDVEIDEATRDSADGSLSFSATLVNASFTASNSVVNGINKKPGQFTSGEGAITGQEVMAPSPLVNWPGFLLIPFTTEFDAVNDAFTNVAEKFKEPSALSRVALSISTSPGELARVSTAGTRLVSESPGKT